MQESEMGNTQG